MERSKLAKALNMPAKSTDDQLLNKLKETIKKGTDAFEGWSFDDFLEKSPKALLEIIDSNPERYEKLNAEYFEGAGLSKTGYKEAPKRMLKKAKSQMMELSQEQRDDFKESYPEEFKKIMGS